MISVGPSNIDLIFKSIILKSEFKIPKLIIPKNLSQLRIVYFRFRRIEPIREKCGLNYIQDLKKREKEDELICEALHDKLKNKWNPLLHDGREIILYLEQLENLELEL